MHEVSKTVTSGGRGDAERTGSIHEMLKVLEMVTEGVVGFCHLFPPVPN